MIYYKLLHKESGELIGRAERMYKAEELAKSLSTPVSHVTVVKVTEQELGTYRGSNVHVTDSQS